MKIHYSECPVCSSLNINPLLTVKDYSVSKEEFVLWQCGNCGLRFTQDVPDEQSIQPYYKSPGYISHSNTDTGLLNKIYKKVRNYTLEQKSKLVIQYTTSRGNLLDVGAGIGSFLHTMQKKGWSIKGIEPDEGARTVAIKTYHLNLKETLASEHLPSKSFDAITLWHVLEHIHSLHDYLNQLKELLKEEGKLFIAVPNYDSTDANIYKTYWAAYDVPRHLYHFNPKSMEQLMKVHGLKIHSKMPMWFDSFYISLLSSKYRNKKTKWLTSIFNGLYSNIISMFNKERCSSIIYIVGKGQ